MIDSSEMHLLFVDESGTAPGPSKQRDAYFVVAGVAIPEGSWHKLRDSFDGMKIRRKLRGELKWRFFAPNNNDAKNPMRTLAQPDRDEIREELLAMLCSDRAIRSIVCVSDIKAAYNMPSVNNKDDLYESTYKPLSERFQYYLQGLDSKAGEMEYGIIICDHRGGADDKRLKAHHQMLIHSTSQYTSKYDNFIESLLLQSSNLSIGIQFADLVAGATWRYFEKGDDRWFKAVIPSLRTDHLGNFEGYGIVKNPKKTWMDRKKLDAG